MERFTKDCLNQINAQDRAIDELVKLIEFLMNRDELDTQEKRVVNDLIELVIADKRYIYIPELKLALSRAQGKDDV